MVLTRLKMETAHLLFIIYTYLDIYLACSSRFYILSTLKNQLEHALKVAKNAKNDMFWSENVIFQHF